MDSSSYYIQIGWVWSLSTQRLQFLPRRQNCDGAHGQEINDEVRRNHGYTPGEVEELMQLFRALDSERS